MKKNVKKLLALTLACLFLGGCGEKADETAALPAYTPVPAQTAIPLNENKDVDHAKKMDEGSGKEETDQKKDQKDDNGKTRKVSSVNTKTGKDYKEEKIDVSVLEGVENFTIRENGEIVCHDDNSSGNNYFSVYTLKDDKTWKVEENEVIANFVEKYHVQVTKMKQFLVTDYDETIFMGDDQVIYKADEEGNIIADAKMKKLFGKGRYEINDWYWYKGCKVILNYSKYDEDDRLREQKCAQVDIDANKVVKKYDSKFEARLVKDGKIYGDIAEQNVVTNIVVYDAETGKLTDKISATGVRKTAIDRNDWDDDRNDYCRNADMEYDVYKNNIYIKYLTGVYRYDAKKKKWDLLMKESKKTTMLKCSPCTFRILDENHLYMMGKKGFYLYYLD